MKHQINIRASDLLVSQLDELTEKLGTSITETVSLAIDRMYQQETKTMDSQTQQMLNELKAATKLNQHEREQLEDKYTGKLPLHSGTISYVPNLIESIIEQTENYVRDWEHASTITNIPYAPDLETCRRHIKQGKEIIEYLRTK